MFGVMVAIAGTLGIVARRAAGRLVAGPRPPRRGFTGCLARHPCEYPVRRDVSARPGSRWSAGLLTPMIFFGSMPFGVAPAATQHMMPNTMRSQASALYLFAINLIGMGLGPTIVGL